MSDENWFLIDKIPLPLMEYPKREPLNPCPWCGEDTQLVTIAPIYKGGYLYHYNCHIEYLSWLMERSWFSSMIYMFA